MSSGSEAAWIEVYEVGFADGPRNVLKPRPAREADWSMLLVVNVVSIEKKAEGWAELVRTRGVREMRGATQEAMLAALDDFLKDPHVRLLRDDIVVNEPSDVPMREPATEELLSGSAGIYKRKGK
jgi:hypothetical protein